MGNLLVGVVRRSGGNIADFGPVKFREEVRWSKRETKLDCLSQKDLLNIRGYQTIRSASALGIGPSTHADFAAARNGGNRLNAATDFNDFVSRIHHDDI